MLVVINKITKEPTAKLVSLKNELAKSYPDAEFLGYVSDNEIYRVSRTDSGIIYNTKISKTVRKYLDINLKPKFVPYDNSYKEGLEWIRAYFASEVESAIRELKCRTNKRVRA